MARIRVEENRQIANWQEADHALRDLALIELDMKGHDLEAKREVEKIKAELDIELRKLKLQKDEIEMVLRQFCDDHRGDFAGKKSRELLFGTVSYRDVSRVVETLTVEEIIKLIRARYGERANQFLDIKVKPAKRAIGKLNDNELPKIGFRREREFDVFGYTPNWKEIKKIEEEG